MIEKYVFEDLIAKNLSQRKIAEELNLSQSTVRWYLNEYDLTTNYKKNLSENSSLINKLTDDEFVEIVNSSDTFTAIIFKIGWTNLGGVHYNQIVNRMALCGIDVEVFRNKVYSHPFNLTGNGNKIPLSEILVENSDKKLTSKRLIKESVLEPICAKCGLGEEWQSESITLQVDHINGNNRDNRIKNLRLLCPNCHSQTQTWGSRNFKVEKEDRLCSICGAKIWNKNETGICIRCTNRGKKGEVHIDRRKVKDRPDRETLIKQVEESSYVAVGRLYGVSDNAIRKWLK